jgi:unsaturated chondroitin disaccharide hydrolase
MVSHALGHALMSDHDERINLLERALKHIEATANFAVYYGEGRDSYDEWGRTAHESIFNTNDGHYRCPNAQQGFSGIHHLDPRAGLGDGRVRRGAGVHRHPRRRRTRAARRAGKVGVADAQGRDGHLRLVHRQPAADGIPYWDGGAPGW